MLVLTNEGTASAADDVLQGIDLKRKVHRIFGGGDNGVEIAHELRALDRE